jgi:hypothetical protein
MKRNFFANVIPNFGVSCFVQILYNETNEISETFRTVSQIFSPITVIIIIIINKSDV